MADNIDEKENKSFEKQILSNLDIVNLIFKYSHRKAILEKNYISEIDKLSNKYKIDVEKVYAKMLKKEEKLKNKRNAEIIQHTQIYIDNINDANKNFEKLDYELKYKQEKELQELKGNYDSKRYHINNQYIIHRSRDRMSYKQKIIELQMKQNKESKEIREKYKRLKNENLEAVDKIIEECNEKIYEIKNNWDQRHKNISLFYQTENEKLLKKFELDKIEITWKYKKKEFEEQKETLKILDQIILKHYPDIKKVQKKKKYYGENDDKNEISGKIIRIFNKQIGSSVIPNPMFSTALSKILIDHITSEKYFKKIENPETLDKLNTWIIDQIVFEFENKENKLLESSNFVCKDHYTTVELIEKCKEFQKASVLLFSEEKTLMLSKIKEYHENKRN